MKSMETPEPLIKTVLSHIVTPITVYGAMAISFGAFVGGIYRVMKEGWMGWVRFGMLFILNVFFGFTAFLVAISQGFSVINSVLVCLAFSFLGEKGGAWFFDNFKSVILQTIFDYVEFVRRRNIQ